MGILLLVVIIQNLLNVLSRVVYMIFKVLDYIAITELLKVHFLLYRVPSPVVR